MISRVSVSAAGVTSTEPLSLGVTVGAAGLASEVVGFFPALPVASSEVFSPFLSLAVTLLPSLILFAGIVTLPVFSSMVTPSGVLSPFFHLPSVPFLTVMVFGLVSPSGV